MSRQEYNYALSSEDFEVYKHYAREPYGSLFSETIIESIQNENIPPEMTATKHYKELLEKFFNVNSSRFPSFFTLLLQTSPLYDSWKRNNGEKLLPTYSALVNHYLGFDIINIGPSQKCAICFDAEPTTILIPCGHICCHSCTETLKNQPCPILTLEKLQAMEQLSDSCYKLGFTLKLIHLLCPFCREPVYAKQKLFF